MDDTMDTLDTSVDIRALEDAGDFDDIDVTEQLPALPSEELDVTALTSITGGMRWQEFRRSTNVEDRRGPKAIARDQQWWDRTQPSIPLPTSRPEGI
jgi:hypothetical protein